MYTYILYVYIDAAIRCTGFNQRSTNPLGFGFLIHFFYIKTLFLISLPTAAGLFEQTESLFGITKARKKLRKMLHMENIGERKISRAVSEE